MPASPRMFTDAPSKKPKTTSQQPTRMLTVIQGFCINELTLLSQKIIQGRIDNDLFTKAKPNTDLITEAIKYYPVIRDYWQMVFDKQQNTSIKQQLTMKYPAENYPAKFTILNKLIRRCEEIFLTRAMKLEMT